MHVDCIIGMQTGSIITSIISRTPQKKGKRDSKVTVCYYVRRLATNHRRKSKREQDEKDQRKLQRILNKEIKETKKKPKKL